MIWLGFVGWWKDGYETDGCACAIDDGCAGGCGERFCDLVDAGGVSDAVRGGCGGSDGEKVKMVMNVEIERCAALVVKYEYRKEKGFMGSFYKGERIWDC